MNSKLSWFRKALGREQFTVCGSIQGAGAANPTLNYGPGIKSITRTGVGAYTFNLLDGWVGGLVSFTFDYGDTNYGVAATRKRVIYVGSDVVNAKTISIQVEDASADAASELTVTQLVAFEFVLRNTKDV